MGNAIYSALAPGEVFATLDMNVRFHQAGSYQQWRYHDYGHRSA
jgi:hypothetical protein